jgi:hypothetical protein
MALIKLIYHEVPEQGGFVQLNVLGLMFGMACRSPRSYFDNVRRFYALKLLAFIAVAAWGIVAAANAWHYFGGRH